MRCHNVCNRLEVRNFKRYLYWRALFLFYHFITVTLGAIQVFSWCSINYIVDVYTMWCRSVCNCCSLFFFVNDVAIVPQKYICSCGIRIAGFESSREENNRSREHTTWELQQHRHWSLSRISPPWEAPWGT